jgi:protein-L-isoaspartate(D-aspartate) O-methyltransferase
MNHQPEDPYLPERRLMVKHQIEARGVRDPRVLNALLTVPRHLFIPPGYRKGAYGDHPLPIGHGQTISQPYIVALMTEMLDLSPSDKVLEIGAGCGYQAAILAHIARYVVTIERLPDLARFARENLESQGVRNVRVVEGDGTKGYPPDSPYDAIIITAAAPSIPSPLIDQLAEGGRIVAPVGTMEIQTLTKGIKVQGKMCITNHGGCRFVPLIGEYGWRE